MFYRGCAGVVNISVPGVPLPIDPRGINASQQLSTQFPFNLDYNSGDTIGFGESLGATSCIMSPQRSPSCVSVDSVDGTRRRLEMS